jgi:hypothetical protein
MRIGTGQTIETGILARLPPLPERETGGDGKNYDKKYLKKNSSLAQFLPQQYV